MSYNRNKNRYKNKKSKDFCTKTIYSKGQYNEDEKSLNDSIDNNKPVNWSSFQRLMMHDLCMNNTIDTFYCGHHSLESINAALEHPTTGYRILLDTSDYLMRISPHYNKVNTYFSNMAVLNWGLDIYDVKEDYSPDKLKKAYYSLSSQLEKMSLKHEFARIMKTLPYMDVYCGVIMENTTDFFIQQLDYRICKISQIQDGVYNFKINLSGINPININAYPIYIQQAYLQFQQGEIDRWYSPPADKQICLKLNSHLTYPFPMLIAIVRDIFDLDTYKKLKLQSARTDNYKAIIIKVPIDEATIDKPLLTPDTLGIFAEMNKESMSDDIGLIHTLGSEGKAVSFKDSANSRNNVADATDDIYNSSGVPKEAFNGSASGTSMTYSLENDSGIIYGIYRQFERWINRYIKINKYNKPLFKFLFYILDMTIYNKDKVINKYQNACQYGAPVKDKFMAALDMTPSRIEGALVLEKDVFQWDKRWIPLKSSHTQNSADVGRPTSESQGEILSDSGEQTQNNDSNSKR